MEKAAVMFVFSGIYFIVFNAIAFVFTPISFFFIVWLVAIAADELTPFEGLVVIIPFALFFDLSAVHFLGAYLMIGIALHWFTIQYLRFFTIDTLFGQVFLVTILTTLARSIIAALSLIKGVHGTFTFWGYCTDLVTNVPAFLLYLALYQWISSRLNKSIDRNILMEL